VLESFDERSLVCKLEGLEYPRSEVLNQRIDNSLRFYCRGQMIRHWRTEVGSGGGPEITGPCGDTATLCAGLSIA
jgi:hypothetical protein